LKLIEVDPLKRLSAVEALGHPWFKEKSKSIFASKYSGGSPSTNLLGNATVIYSGEKNSANNTPNTRQTNKRAKALERPDEASRLNSEKTLYSTFSFGGN
jgi:serine/threonine protein kinase